MMTYKGYRTQWEDRTSAMDKSDMHTVISDVPDGAGDELRVTIAGRFRQGPDYYQAARTLADEYVIIYTEDGKGWVGVPGEMGIAGPGDAVVLPPGVEHRYRTDGDLWALIWFHCRGSFPGRLGSWLASRQWIPPTPCGDLDLIRHFEAIIDELEGRPPHFDQGAAARAHLAIVGIVRSFSLNGVGTNEPKGTAAARLDEICAYIRAHLNRDLSVGELQERFHISARHLARLFHQRFAQTPKEYILRLKLAEAKRLLYATDLTVAAVARRVGYHDPYYFSRVFKRKTGESPSAFRRSRA